MIIIDKFYDSWGFRFPITIRFVFQFIYIYFLQFIHRCYACVKIDSMQSSRKRSRQWLVNALFTLFIFFPFESEGISAEWLSRLKDKDFDHFISCNSPVDCLLRQQSIAAFFQCISTSEESLSKAKRRKFGWERKLSIRYSIVHI